MLPIIIVSVEHTAQLQYSEAVATPLLIKDCFALTLSSFQLRTDCIYMLNPQVKQLKKYNQLPDYSLQRTLLAVLKL